jgi:hypothetical protein
MAGGLVIANEMPRSGSPDPAPPAPGSALDSLGGARSRRGEVARAGSRKCPTTPVRQPRQPRVDGSFVLRDDNINRERWKVRLD